MAPDIPRTPVVGRGRRQRKNTGDTEEGRKWEEYAERGRGMCPIHEDLPVHRLSSLPRFEPPFRNHRVIIASLFLPTTVVVGESESATPDKLPEGNAAVSIPAVAQRLAKEATKPLKSALSNKPALQPAHNSHSRSSSATGAILSIVDDLKDKAQARTPQAAQDKQERPNIFTKLTRFAEETPGTPKPERTGQTAYPDAHGGIISALASPTRKHQTTHSEDKGTPRIQRRKSRSMSKSRRHSSVSSPIIEDGPRFAGNWHFELSTTCNGGLRNAVESVSERLRKKLWVGTLGTPTDNFKDNLRNEIDDRLRSRRDSVPVWIPDAEFTSAYDEFCHQVLWPALHYAVPDAPKTKMFYESATYKQYVAVNQRFAETIASIYQEGDVIFINDYHLMLLPLMLRKILPPTAAIGFFLHVAFPTSEIFRCLAMRKELLLGILGADFVGFQTANYARHFRQTVTA
ncbi:hypothetical protein NMY22_g19723 [Coprinellus aureogranulatus]|nr:hypothetical protein NMY22_g19723 [Coprinellus aureogranulatus]